MKDSSCFYDPWFASDWTRLLVLTTRLSEDDFDLSPEDWMLCNGINTGEIESDIKDVLLNKCLSVMIHFVQTMKSRAVLEHNFEILQESFSTAKQLVKKTDNDLFMSITEINPPQFPADLISKTFTWLHFEVHPEKNTHFPLTKEDVNVQTLSLRWKNALAAGLTDFDAFHSDVTSCNTMFDVEQMDTIMLIYNECKSDDESDGSDEESESDDGSDESDGNGTDGSESGKIASVYEDGSERGSGSGSGSESGSESGGDMQE